MGFFHSNIKPENILIDDNIVKLSDFSFSQKNAIEVKKQKNIGII